MTVGSASKLIQPDTRGLRIARGVLSRITRNILLAVSQEDGYGNLRRICLDGPSLEHRRQYSGRQDWCFLFSRSNDLRGDVREVEEWPKRLASARRKLDVALRVGHQHPPNHLPINGPIEGFSVRPAQEG